MGDRGAMAWIVPHQIRKDRSSHLRSNYIMGNVVDVVLFCELILLNLVGVIKQKDKDEVYPDREERHPKHS